MSLRQTPIILLAEDHLLNECTIKNIAILRSLLATKNFLFVSEGSIINTCYQELEIPEESILIEYEPMTQSRFIIKLLTSFYYNGFLIFQKIMNEEWEERLIPALINVMSIKLLYYDILLDKANVKRSFLKALEAVKISDRDKYIKYMKKIFRGLRDTGLNDLTNFREKTELQEKLQENIDTNFSREAMIHLEEQLRFIRETRLMKRIERRVRSTPDIDGVIIIFGQNHYDNLKRLIERSGIFIFDEEHSDRGVGDIGATATAAAATAAAATATATPIAPSKSRSTCTVVGGKYRTMKKSRKNRKLPRSNII